MQLTRSGSDPTAFRAQPFWQRRRSFTSPEEMSCDEHRKSTDRNEAGSTSSSDQKAALLTSSTVRESLAPLFMLI
jgi:hypothetical protein